MRHTQLRSFHAVAQSGSFTAAARELGVSQPTITTQVKSLEGEFGVELFVRRGRRIELTETGGGLLRHHAAAVRRREGGGRLPQRDARAQNRPSAGRRGRALPRHRHAGGLQRALSRTLRLGDGRQFAPDAWRDLLDYRTDVAVLAHVDPDPRLVAIPYRRHRVVVMCPADHAFARRRGLRVREMEGQRLIVREAGSTTRRAFDQAMREAGVEPQRRDGDRQPRIDPRGRGQGDRPRRGVGGRVHPRSAPPRPAGHRCRRSTPMPMSCICASGRTRGWSAPSFGVLKGLLPRHVPLPR